MGVDSAGRHEDARAAGPGRFRFLVASRSLPQRAARQAGTATGFSIGIPTMLPHSVHDPS
jgi:hypothetical protein